MQKKEKIPRKPKEGKDSVASDFVGEQQNDEYYRELPRQILSNVHKIMKSKIKKKVLLFDGVEENGVRYTILTDGTITTTTGRLVVPKCKIEKVFWRFHNDACAGYLVVKKTLNRIQRRFIWPGMNRDVVDYVKKCLTFAKWKIFQHNKPLRPIQPPEEIWKLKAMDIVGHSL